MAKAKIIKKPKVSLRKSKPVILLPYKTSDSKYLDHETLRAILVEALIDGDIEMLKDVLVAQIRLHNKADLVRKSKLGRQTLYDLIDGKRERRTRPLDHKRNSTPKLELKP
jgi:DNA-binding phage protein